MKTIKPRLYEIVDSFLAEAPDQNGKYRSLDRLNQDRHLAVEALEKLILSEMTALMKECVGEEKVIDENEKIEDLADSSMYMFKLGYNEKRQEIKEISAKHGLKI